MASSSRPVVDSSLRSPWPEAVILSNGGRTATRRRPIADYGVLFSSTPLLNDTLFQIQIGKTSENCQNGIEIGVITCEPDAVEMAVRAATIVNGSWIHSGDRITRNSTPCMHLPNKNLNNLGEGDTCGVMRTSSGDLIFDYNGECVGIIAQNMPPRIYAVVDLSEKCLEITLQPFLKLKCPQHHDEKSLRLCPVLSPNVPYFSNLQLCPDFNVCVSLPLYKSNGQYAFSQENFVKNNKSKLRFHQHCGNLVKLSVDRKTAERRDPLDEFNNGVVMTHRTLNDDELFEIRIDELVNKWSGSLEVGITIHNPLLIEFPTTMTNMHSGTIMMSGCGILINGKGTRREYGQFNLDKLKEGDRVGMMRRSNGNLHYFINSLDQGVAASKIPQRVWGVIDLYGMTTKVTIIDPEEKKFYTPVQQRKLSVSNFNSYTETCKKNNATETSNSTDRLLFHSNCGAHAVVSNRGLTAYRPRATDDFNNGVVLTNRPLKPDEVFEVRLDKVVKKWAGSIEIGVTTHTPHDLDFPITMTNMRSGTWMMTGNGVMHNGTTVQDRYGNSLDRIIVGDRVGVVRQSCGTLRFYINGIDQGPATTGVPENIYGVIDLYGQAAQASIVQFVNSPESLPSCISNTTLHGGDLCFHRIHGHNVRVQGIGLVATRIASMVNFEDALLFSSRPLRECEMFQVRVSEVLETWDRCIAFGVTAANPNEFTLPSNFKGITQDTYILQGSTLIHNDCVVSEKYSLNLFNLSVNSRIGIMRHADRSVHFYLDGMDQGKAWDVYNLNIYGIIDMSGQCLEICMSPPKSRGFSGNSDNSLNMPTTGLQCSHITKHIFSEYCGTNIEINSDYTMARVVSLTAKSNLVFSASLLHPDGLFEIEVVNCDNSFAGSMRIGVTDVNILNAYVNSKLPSSMLELPSGTMYIEGNQQITVGSNLVNAIYPSLRWLKTKDRVGLRRIGFSDCIALQLNTEEISVVFRNVPDKVFVVFELCGPQTSIRAVSTEAFPCDEVEMEASDDGNSLHLIGCSTPIHNDKMNESENISKIDSMDQLPIPTNGNDNYRQNEMSTIHKKPISFFHINHGGNVIIEKQGTGVRRLTGYNRAIVIGSKPVFKGQSFKFQVTKTNTLWNSSLLVGASKTALALRLPTSAIDLKQGCWIVSADHLYLDGNNVWSNYGKSLEALFNGCVICLEFTENRELHLIVDNTDLGCFAKLTQKINKIYPIVDIYGQCEQISIISDDINPINTDSEFSDIDVSENLSKGISDKVCSQSNGDTEQESDENTSYYKTIQLCEKAYLEYYEKEYNSLILANENSFYAPPSVSSSKHPSDEKYVLSKSLSENESFNLALQNVSMTNSETLTNESKNREIKRRTTALNNSQSVRIDNQKPTKQFQHTKFVKDCLFRENLSFPFICNDNCVLKSSQSLENFIKIVPSTFVPLPKKRKIDNSYDFLLRFWQLWEFWHQYEGKIINEESEDKHTFKSVVSDFFIDQKTFSRVLFKNQKYENVSRINLENDKNVSNTMSLTCEKDVKTVNKSECILSVLRINAKLTNKIRKLDLSSHIGNKEYCLKSLIDDKTSDSLFEDEDDIIYYIRELFYEFPNNDCTILREAIMLKKYLGLPDYFFTDDPPKCYCDNCHQTKIKCDIPKGWVQFFLNKPYTKWNNNIETYNYWLCNTNDIKYLFPSKSDLGLIEGQTLIIPCERLPSHHPLDNIYNKCIDKKHWSSKMRAAFEVSLWQMQNSSPKDYVEQIYSIHPVHYYVQNVGYCQVNALLLGA